MKKVLFFLSLVLVSTFAYADVSTLSPEDSLSASQKKTEASADSIPEFTPRTPTGKRYPTIVPFAEVIAQNVLVWAWDYAVLRKDYAKTGPSYWKRNYREGWQWDDNHFAINFFGHPYQGSMYYSAARASGYSFYESFLFAFTGSYVWEMFCETEYPAPNDLIATSVGGTIYGEMLYRISTRVLSKPDAGILDNIFAFVSSPIAYLQERVTGASPTNPGYAPLNWSVFIGVGHRFGSEYRYDEDADVRSDSDWNSSSLGYGLNLVYGRANRKIQKPFEYFTFDFNQEQSEDGMMMRMNSVGKLKNIHLNSGENWVDLATYLHFDTFYGDLVEMSALAIGLGADVSIHLSENLNFRMIHMPSFVMLGSSDFNYGDVLALTDSTYEETRDYQYSLGLSYKSSIEIELKKWGKLYNSVAAYLFHTMPNTEPHYGTNGYDFVIFNSAGADLYLPLRFSLGLSLNSYAKIAAYERVQPMSRTMHSINLYTRYNF